MKKLILFFVITLICNIANATNYYIKNGGNDSNDGLSHETAWATFAKACSASVFGGDSLLFNRGDTFDVFETCNVIRSGSVGDLVNLTGWNTPANWTQESDIPNVWSMNFNEEVPWQLTIDSTEYEPAFLPHLICTSDITNTDVQSAWVDYSTIKADVWYIPLATDPEKVYIVGESKTEASSINNISLNTPWFYDSGAARLYVFANDVNPAIYWGTLKQKTSTCSNNRWHWRPTKADLSNYKLYVYSTSNPATAFSTMEYRNSANHITFGAYGTGEHPIIDCTNPITGWDTPGNWVDYTGTIANVWYLPNITTSPTRLFIEGVDYPSAEALSGKTYNISNTYRWYYNASQDRVYVYSAGGNPATAYSLIEGNQDCNSMLYVNNDDYIKIDGLDMRGARSNIINSRGAKGLIIQNSKFGYGGYANLMVGGSTPSFNPNKNYIFRNNILNHNQNYADGVGYDDISGVREAHAVRQSLSNAWIYNNITYQYDHGHWHFEAVSTNNKTDFPLGLRNIWVFGNESDSSTNYDGRAFSTLGKENLLTDIEIYFNYFHDMWTQAKIDGGPLVYFHDNIFRNGKNPQYQENAYDIAHFVTIICLDDEWDSHGNIIENNIFINNEAPAIRMDQQNSPSCLKSQNQIRNNIFIDNGKAPLVTTLTDVQLEIDTGSNVGDNNYQNNLMFVTGKDSTTKTVYYGGSKYTVAEFNALSGSTYDIFANNVYGDPAFINAAAQNYLLSVGSPAIDVGYDSILRVFDYDGNDLSLIDQDIGPFEYQSTVSPSVNFGSGTTIKNATFSGVTF